MAEKFIELLPEEEEKNALAFWAGSFHVYERMPPAGTYYHFYDVIAVTLPSLKPVVLRIYVDETGYEIVGVSFLEATPDDLERWHARLTLLQSVCYAHQRIKEIEESNLIGKYEWFVVFNGQAVLVDYERNREYVDILKRERVPFVEMCFPAVLLREKKKVAVCYAFLGTVDACYIRELTEEEGRTWAEEFKLIDSFFRVREELESIGFQLSEHLYSELAERFERIP